MFIQRFLPYSLGCASGIGATVFTLGLQPATSGKTESLPNQLYSLPLWGLFECTYTASADADASPASVEASSSASDGFVSVSVSVCL
jgi:hypothetical protein